MNEYKLCKDCGIDKPIDEFRYIDKKKGYRDSYCKMCKNKRSIHYNNNNKDVVKKSQTSLRNRNKINIKEYLQSHPCVDCGNNDIRVLEFDHVKSKTASISDMILDYSWGNILKEIKKCEVRCANCHRIKTMIERKSYRSYKMIK